MRARNLKPSIFNNEQLARLGSDHFRLFEALWCMADRKGRLEDRPEQIESKSFPFKFQKVDVQKMLDNLADCSEHFITRYERDGKRYIQVSNFLKHNYPHIREKESTIPAPGKHSASTRRAHLNPESCIPESNTPLNPPKGGTLVAKPYLRPDPEKDPTGALICAYKVLKGFAWDDRNWDKRHQPRARKAAKDLIEACGGLIPAHECMKALAKRFKDAGLDWNFNTLVKHADDWMLAQRQKGETDGRVHSQGVSKPESNREAAPRASRGGGFVTAGEVLSGIRSLQAFQNPTKESDGPAVGGDGGR